MPLYSSPPSEVRKRTRNLETKAHDDFICESIWASQNGVFKIHHEGRLIEVASPPLWNEYEKPDGKRGKITSFTRTSRFRQMCALARVRRDAALPIFLTLTYPAQWPSEWEEWKEHMASFFRAVEMKYKTAASIWKLEPQQRDAPHFHALIWNIRNIPWQWIAVEWACIIHGLSHLALKGYPVVSGKLGAYLFREWVEMQDVSDIVKDSMNAGVSIEKVKSWRGVAFYAAKYLGKEVLAFEGGAGRFWGIRNRKNMPFSKVDEIWVKVRMAVMFKRLVRRFMHSKGFRASRSWKVKLITDDMRNWLRAAELCCDWVAIPAYRLEAPF